MNLATRQFVHLAAEHISLACGLLEAARLDDDRDVMVDINHVVDQDKLEHLVNRLRSMVEEEPVS